MSAATPAWLAAAYKYVGVAEIPGKATAPMIGRWLQNLKAWWTDDETPWCGVFVAECMRESGVAIPKNYFRALAWLDWGLPLAAPVTGCVVIYSRTGGGHVGLVVGKDLSGRILTLGGNQGNRVSIAPFDPARVAGYRWPAGFAPGAPVQTVAANGASSSNEA